MGEGGGGVGFVDSQWQPTSSPLRRVVRRSQTVARDCAGKGGGCVGWIQDGGMDLGRNPCRVITHLARADEEEEEGMYARP